jgi:hypothetical protein
MNLSEKLSVISQVWAFLRVRKKLWLLPALLTLAILGLLIVTGQSSGLGPFVYPFF